MNPPEDNRPRQEIERSERLKEHDPDLTQALLDFAKPLIDRAHSETTCEEFKNALEFAVNIWNVLAIDAEIPEATVLDDLRSNLGEGNADPETLDMLDLLVERYTKKYSGDRRTMGNLLVSKPETNAFDVTVGRV